MKKGFIIISILLVIAFASGYLLGAHNTRVKLLEEAVNEPLKEEPEKEIPEEKKPEAEKKEEKKEEKKAESVTSGLVKTMSLSEKIYQMLFVTPESITGIGTAVQAGEATKQAINKYPVGGIIYFSANFQSREQTAQLISNTQSYSKIPLFIAVDEEGGRVARLGSNPEMGVTVHPPMRTIGDSGNSDKAYEVGKTLGNDLKALGFNVDFAPDADVIINEGNTEIGDRSFGTDPEKVSLMVEKAVKGLQETGVSATLKHFPGHGSTYVDSHTGYSESKRTMEELRSAELIPFKAGINAGADFVMVSHMTPVNATKEKLPASISSEIINDMLLKELGFKGIVITDSFSMGAIAEEYTIADAAVKAVLAGVDMILMPKNVEETHNAILNAVNDGRISEERINKSVEKILSLKEKKGLI